MINKQLRHTQRHLLFIGQWKMRLAFWGSAILLGLAAWTILGMAGYFTGVVQTPA